MHRTSDRLNFIHYTDDTTVYMSGDSLSRLCESVCEQLDKVDDWLKANRLSLNIDKTYYMIHTNTIFDSDDCVIKIRDKPIQ